MCGLSFKAIKRSELTRSSSFSTRSSFEGACLRPAIQRVALRDALARQFSKSTEQVEKNSGTHPGYRQECGNIGSTTEKMVSRTRSQHSDESCEHGRLQNRLQRCKRKDRKRVEVKRMVGASGFEPPASCSRIRLTTARGKSWSRTCGLRRLLNLEDLTAYEIAYSAVDEKTQIAGK